MSRDHSVSEIRMELKYCEHCGGLWVREGGAGVYCATCQRKVAEMASVKNRPARLTLPKQERTVVQEYDEVIPEKLNDLEAAVGGVA